jgi:transglutaminase-like putative cysteine protease
VSNFSENNIVEDDSKNLAAGEDRQSKLSQSSIIAASSSISSYVSKYGKLPNSVKISGYEFSIAEYLYLASKTIQYQYKKSDSQVKVKYDVKNPKKPSGTNINLKISSSNYYKYATRIVKFISIHSTVPNFLSVGSSKMQYQTIVYAFAKLLTWGNSNDNRLPNSLSINVKKNSNINKHMPRYIVDSKSKTVSSKKLNSNYSGEPLEKYLMASKNCQVDDKKIKSLANKITKKHDNVHDKAKAIFNWVKNKVSYNFYYNTKYGAKKTLTQRVGNCVDQSHLIIALSRASGIAARYVHGICTFISGNTYGHVWAQIKIGDTWYVADSTSSKNSFGAIRSWNTSSYKLNGVYSSLPF